MDVKNKFFTQRVVRSREAVVSPSLEVLNCKLDGTLGSPWAAWSDALSMSWNQVSFKVPSILSSLWLLKSLAS